MRIQAGRYSLRCPFLAKAYENYRSGKTDTPPDRMRLNQELIEEAKKETLEKMTKEEILPLCRWIYSTNSPEIMP
jgi:uncharacterized protein YaaW (UPF0174 family)